METAKTNGYVPNPLARSLATGKTNTVGVVIFDLRNRHFSQFVTAVEKVMTERGYLAYICLTEKDTKTEKKVISDLLARKVDGIIMHPINHSAHFSDYLARQRTPVVMVSNRMDGARCFIGGNNRDAVYSAMRHFVEKHYTDVYFVCPSLSRRATENVYAPLERSLGYQAFLHDNPSLRGGVIDGYPYVEAVEQIIRGAREGERIGFFCGSDFYALEILLSLKKKGLTPPRDYGLMGFDGIDTLNYLETRLTSINYPAERIGLEAATMLHRLIHGESVQCEHLFECSVIEGDTV